MFLVILEEVQNFNYDQSGNLHRNIMVQGCDHL